MADEKSQDALKLLAEDHRTVEALFEKFENAKGASAKQKLVQQICTELKIHTMIEEEVFYPALEGKMDEDLLKEAYVEHDAAKLLVNDLEESEPDEEFYDSKVTVLQEEIEHHIKEEEKDKDSMFAQARKADVDLKAIGAEMTARKDELMKRAKADGLPPAEPTAIAM